MKKYLFFIIAAVVVGFICFATFYWVLKLEKNDAIMYSLTAALTGLTVELIRPLLVMNNKVGVGNTKDGSHVLNKHLKYKGATQGTMSKELKVDNKN